LEDINACRLYLQVETLAELCNAQGTITEDNLWPVQKNPGKDQWNKFRNYVLTTYCQSNKSNSLRKPLGAWIYQNHHRQVFQCYYNHDNSTVTIWQAVDAYDTYRVSGARIGSKGKIVDLDKTTPLYTTASYEREDGVPTQVWAKSQDCFIPQQLIEDQPI